MLCMHVCMYVGMYVGMYVCTHVDTYRYIHVRTLHPHIYMRVFAIFLYIIYA